MTMGKRKDQSGCDLEGRTALFPGYFGTQEWDKYVQYEKQSLELSSSHALYFISQCRLNCHLRRIQYGNAFNRYIRLTRHNHICCDFLTPSDHIAFEER